MKKLLTMIAVFALTAPVFAAEGDPTVRITIVDEGSGVVQVNYEVLDEGNSPGLMRAIALRITTSNSALIDAITDYDAEDFTPPVDSEGIDDVSGYIIYMGSIQFATDPNYVASFGDPVAPSGDDGAGDDLPDAEEIVVEMGSLYSSGGSAPPASGPLFKLQLDANGESDTVLGIEGESTRGGDLGECVLESGQQANIVLSSVPDAYKVEFQPPCWGYDCHMCGDSDGNCSITSADILALVDAWPPKPYDPCADFNHSDTITSADVLILVDHWATGSDPGCTSCGPCTPIP
jgi:hypothetical protein